jgi:hypothetical protein
MSPLRTMRQELHKYACSLCARRKVKCDKGEPCANCDKAQVQCLYEAPAPHRPRKRAGDEDVLNRLAQYEDLMRKHNIDFSCYAKTWVQSNVKDSKPQTPICRIPANSRTYSNNCDAENTIKNGEQYDS